jgi:SAM-dependent methyltransferase
MAGMSMNLMHQWLCRSGWWSRVMRERVLPWALRRVDLGAEVLEIGPGYGAATRDLAGRVPRLTAVELDPRLAERLRRELDGAVRVIQGDGTALPLPDQTFSGVACFTMLHHLPSPELQDRLFAEAFRVLRPGGVFAGSDSLPSLGFRLLHLGDTMVTLPPETLPDRLAAAGFTDVEVTAVPGRSVRFRARRPGA